MASKLVALITAAITVDNVEVAQFLYLILNNSAIRRVIDTLAKKLVLVLGRFAPERKVVLEGLRMALRTRGSRIRRFLLRRMLSLSFALRLTTTAQSMGAQRARSST